MSKETGGTPPKGETISEFAKLVKRRTHSFRVGSQYAVTSEGGEKIVTTDVIARPAAVFTSIRDRQPSSVDEQTGTEHFPTTSVGAAVIGGELTLFKRDSDATRTTGSQASPTSPLPDFSGQAESLHPTDGDFQQAIDLLKRATRGDRLVYSDPEKKGKTVKEIRSGQGRIRRILPI